MYVQLYHIVSFLYYYMRIYHFLIYMWLYEINIHSCRIYIWLYYMHIHQCLICTHRLCLLICWWSIRKTMTFIIICFPILLAIGIICVYGFVVICFVNECIFQGAREFVVPTHSPNQFYTLPQSPQQVTGHWYYCKQIFIFDACTFIISAVFCWPSSPAE